LSGLSPSPFQKIKARRAKSFKAESKPDQEKTKENGLGFSWILLDSFVRFGAFQRVTSNAKKKMSPTPAKAIVLRLSRNSAPHHPAKGIELQLARTPAGPLHAPSLSVPPPRRLIRNA
jgi:hypothetical protein